MPLHPIRVGNSLRCLRINPSVWLLCVIFGSLGMLTAGEDSPKSRPTKPAASDKAASRDTEAKSSAGAGEEAAMKFAAAHHPELATLLKQLRKSAPKEFQSAIQDLQRSQQRLEKSREKTPDRYQGELAEWKLNSRIRLLAARLAMGGDEVLEQELREQLTERIKVRQVLLKEEQGRLTRRLEKIQEQLSELDAPADQVVDRELDSLVRSASKASRSVTAKDSALKNKSGNAPKRSSESNSRRTEKSAPAVEPKKSDTQP